MNGQEHQDRPTNEVRQKEKQPNETKEIMVSEPTVYEVNEYLNTISVNQVIEMSVHEDMDEGMPAHEAEGPGIVGFNSYNYKYMNILC